MECSIPPCAQTSSAYRFQIERQVPLPLSTSFSLSCRFYFCSFSTLHPRALVDSSLLLAHRLSKDMSVVYVRFVFQIQFTLPGTEPSSPVFSHARPICPSRHQIRQRDVSAHSLHDCAYLQLISRRAWLCSHLPPRYLHPAIHTVQIAHLSYGMALRR